MAWPAWLMQAAALIPRGFTKGSLGRIVLIVWRVWKTYFRKEGIHPYLLNQSNKIKALQVFAQQYRDRRIAPCHAPVTSDTVSDAFMSVGQKFTLMGKPNPRFDARSFVDIRLQKQL